MAMRNDRFAGATKKDAMRMHHVSWLLERAKQEETI